MKEWTDGQTENTRPSPKNTDNC